MSRRITFVDAATFGVTYEDWRHIESLPKDNPQKKAALRALRLAKRISRLEKKIGRPITS